MTDQADLVAKVVTWATDPPFAESHVIRGGRIFALELRRDQVPTLAEGPRLLADRARSGPRRGPGCCGSSDAAGEPTGILLATPNALILYSIIAAAPALSLDDQRTSTIQFQTELNSLGITSAIDADRPTTQQSRAQRR